MARYELPGKAKEHLGELQALVEQALGPRAPMGPHDVLMAVSAGFLVAGATHAAVKTLELAHGFNKQWRESDKEGRKDA